MTFLGSALAGGGIGGTTSPGASAAIQDLQPEVVASVNAFALQNGTPSIMAATPVVFNDGNNHLVIVIVTADVTTTETGGAVTATITDGVDGHAVTTTVQPGGSTGPGLILGTFAFAVVGPGSTVSIAQSSALTAGSAKVSARVLAV